MPSRPEPAPRSTLVHEQSTHAALVHASPGVLPRSLIRTLGSALLLALAACSAADDGADTTGETGDNTTSSSTGETGASTGDVPTTGGVYETFDERPCPPDSPLTVINFGAPFMLTHCTGCHHSSLDKDERAGAPLGVDFDDLAYVRDQAAQIWARAADQNMTMPPLGGPAQDERTRLGEWLACGAP